MSVTRRDFLLTGTAAIAGAAAGLRLDAAPVRTPRAFFGLHPLIEKVRGLGMEARMTICNMSIEGGARAGMIAPDETTFQYLAGREYVPQGLAWEDALAFRGADISVGRDGQAPLRGKLLGLEQDGSLRLLSDDMPAIVHFGEIHLRPSDDRIG